MKNENQTQSILVKVSTEQKDAITTAAKAANMNVSEYIRSRATSHRASFQIPGEDNEYYIENEQGFIGDTRTMNVAHSLTRDMSNKFMVHIRDGRHPDCVICRKKEADWKAEITAEENERADYDATIRDARP